MFLMWNALGSLYFTFPVTLFFCPLLNKSIKVDRSSISIIYFSVQLLFSLFCAIWYCLALVILYFSLLSYNPFSLFSFLLSLVATQQYIVIWYDNSFPFWFTFHQGYWKGEQKKSKILLSSFPDLDYPFLLPVLILWHSTPQFYFGFELFAIYCVVRVLFYRLLIHKQ